MAGAQKRTFCASGAAIGYRDVTLSFTGFAIMRTSFQIPLFLTLAATALAGCSTSRLASAPTTDASPASGTPAATATLEAKSDSQVHGQLDFSREGSGLRVRGEVRGLSANGVHAFHIHEKGDCSAPDGSSAGGHFNPGGHAHGRTGHGEHHLGDQDNLHANAEGNARVDAFFPDVNIGEGGSNDVLGKAVIIHAGEDDYHSQPTGNAGGRLACGLIAVPAAN